MGEQEPDVYQGNDWITYRWSVAQAFDTLDQIRELCNLAPDGFAIDAPTDVVGTILASPASPGEAKPQSQIEMIAMLWSLCDDLGSEINTVLADLFVPLRLSPALQWKGFELRLHLDALRAHALHDAPGVSVDKGAVDSITALTACMRDALKHIDQ